MFPGGIKDTFAKTGRSNKIRPLLPSRRQGNACHRTERAHEESRCLFLQNNPLPVWLTIVWVRLVLLGPRRCVRSWEAFLSWHTYIHITHRTLFPLNMVHAFICLPSSTSTPSSSRRHKVNSFFWDHEVIVLLAHVATSSELLGRRDCAL